MEMPDDGEGDVAVGVDTECFIGEFVGEVGYEYGELIVGAEQVGGVGGWWCLGNEGS